MLAHARDDGAIVGVFLELALRVTSVATSFSMPEDVSPDASPPPVGSTNRSKPHSKPMATGQCHPRPALLHLRLLIPSSNHHHISASFPHRVLSRYHLFPARLTPQPPITKKPLFYRKAHALPAMVSYTLAAARHLPTSQYIITNSLAQSAQNSAGIQTLLDVRKCLLL